MTNGSERVSRLIRELTTEQSAEAMLRRGLRALLQAAGASAGALFVCHDRPDEPRLAASHGLPLALLRELDQAKKGSSVSPSPALAAMVSLPLTLAGRTVGILALVAPAGVDWSGPDYANFRALCDVLGIMVEQGRLRAERDRLRQVVYPPRLETSQMAALLKITSRLGRSLKLDAVLTTVLQEATSHLSAEAGALYLNEGGHLVRAAACGPDEELGLADETAAQVAGEGAPVVGVREGQAMAAVPVASEEKTIGVLICVRQGAEAFSGEEAVFLRMLAGHAATAIENARLHEETEERSVRDALTGLYNLRQLEVRLGEEVRRAERYGGELSFIMLDIDHFKRYNDTFGHLQGDQALRRVAGVICHSVRSADQVFRYGGEEFCVILPETPPLQAWLVAERIRMAVSSSSLVGEEDQDLARLSVSLGVAAYPQDATTPRDLLARADAALYRAKAQGRNRVATAWGAPRTAQEKTVMTSSTGRRGRSGGFSAG
jgi:diguanylate cyclase (GGDEF)-like protein